MRKRVRLGRKAAKRQFRKKSGHLRINTKPVRRGGISL